MKKRILFLLIVGLYSVAANGMLEFRCFEVIGPKGNHFIESQVKCEDESIHTATFHPNSPARGLIEKPIKSGSGLSVKQIMPMPRECLKMHWDTFIKIKKSEGSK